MSAFIPNASAPLDDYVQMVVAFAPTISNITPITGPSSGGTNVSLSGNNLNGVIAVTVGGQPATNLVARSNSLVTFTTPAGSGAAEVKVTIISGSTTLSGGFRYIAAPVAANSSVTVAENSSGTAVGLSLSGDAPTSLAITSNPTHGTATVNGTSITYTPNAAYVGSDGFQYTATNASGTSSAATVAVTVATDPITVAAATLTPGTTGAAYTNTLVASGGGQPPYTFNASPASGSLPPGITLSGTGALSGTPTTAGTYSFTVSGVDSSTGTPQTFTSGTIVLQIVAAIVIPPVTPSVPIGYATIYDRMARVTKRLIRKFTTGSVVILREVTQPDPNDPTASISGVYTSPNTAAVIMGYSDNLINGDTIHAGDRQVYLAANDLEQIPIKGDVIIIDAVKHVAISVQQILAAGKICLYIVQARTANG